MTTSTPVTLSTTTRSAAKVSTRFRWPDPSAGWRSHRRLLSTGQRLRLSAGAIIDGDRTTGLAGPAGTARIGARFYDVANAVSVSLKALVNTVLPYVGFGYSARILGDLVALIDAGVLVEGDPRVSLAVNGPAAALPSFLSQVDDERRRIARDVSVPVNPVVELGIG